uniref:Phospholipase A(2) n=1 Tax=Steinernema glaseri TaxID=37863 RepID=A0A1I7YQA5_9BILA
MLAGYFLLVFVALATAAIKDPDMNLEKNDLTLDEEYPVETFNFVNKIIDRKTIDQQRQIEQFSCGTGLKSTWFAWETVTRTCKKEEYAPIDACCRAHDACYDHQEGQKKCDDDFCLCLREAQRKRNGLRCYMNVKGMCYSVRLLGKPAYEKAG